MNIAAEKTKVAVAHMISGNHDREPVRLTRKGKLARFAGLVLATGAVLHGPVTQAVENVSSAVVHKFDELIPGDTTHVEEVKQQIEDAKSNPEEAPKGKYVWYTVGENENPTTIAEKLAPGISQDHAEIYDEVLAQQDANGFIQPGPLLVEVDHITSNDQKLQNELEQFNK